MDILLKNLIHIADGIADSFGSDCEVVIHDLHTVDTADTIVYIRNGHVTGRKVGDGPSRVVLKSMEAMQRGELLSERHAYETRTSDGRILKSTTMFIRSEQEIYRYILGFNLDITALVNARKALQNIESFAYSGDSEAEVNIPINVNDLLDSLIAQSVELIGKDPSEMTKDEKIRAIRFLDSSGAFLITRSGDKVADYYGISKFTLYSYIDKKGTGGYGKKK